MRIPDTCKGRYLYNCFVHCRLTIMCVPFKTMVMYSIYTASRDPKYVENPTSFKPERWTKNSEEDIDAFISLPFGFGPRSCYGNYVCV